MKYLINWLSQNADNEHCLFTLADLKVLLPEMSHSAFKTLLSRAVSANYLIRICRGLYAYKQALPTTGLILFHIAARLRAGELNYLSLETALSDAGVISQIPLNWISIMSSGRSNTISCREYGTIEFVHTSQEPKELVDKLSYDSRCKLWRASVPLAIRDMKATHRNCDLIDWDVVNEFI